MAFGDAFKRPFQDFKSLLIGIVIMLIPIVNFIGIGYLLKCANTTTRRNYKLPAWEGWADMFLKGILAIIIGIIYMIPVMIALVFTIGFAVLTAGGVSGISGLMSIPTLLTTLAAAGIGLVITGIVGIIFGLLCTAAIVRYADTGKFSSAFELNAIFKKAFTGTFFAAWLIGVVYATILSVILGLIPFLGGAIASFIGGVTAITLVAEAYSKA